MMPVLTPTEIGEFAAQAIIDLSARAIGGMPIATYVEGDPMPWSVIADGGWDLVGAPETDGGGATLIDLVTIARAWGRTCLPLPYITSLMAKRWSAAAREHGGPISFAIADPAALDTGRIPFGAMPGLLVLAGSDAEPVVVQPGSPDSWVPSIRPIPSSWVTIFAADQATELAVVWAAEATGGAEQALQLSVNYARERVQFGRPIGSFQAVKHTLASMKVMTEAAETAVLKAALEPRDAHRTARWALDTSLTVIEMAIQVHGGMGFTWELGMHHYLRHMVTLRELVEGLHE